MNGFKPFCLDIWGDYACFTRPEMKVERVSYDVITPSAARAVFEAIFWKPAIRWWVKKIEVLNPVKWMTVRRNEIGSIMSERSDGIIIEKARQQRASLLLRDVRFRIHATLEYIPFEKRKMSEYMKVPEYLWDSQEKELIREEIKAFETSVDTVKKGESPGKYLAMFERRAKKGQCFNHPYLGCREFACHFRLVEDIANEPEPICENRDLGYMLYDMDFSISQDPKPAFFRAKLEKGVINVPDWESKEVVR
ncbi:type I-C CRISPR-associated protein Cas5 [Candidatus Peregrinibacteria bacterium]|nr:type I-C CRISPR-associated protein Cas5 [Candidatus Peregrinibacteria bacterium]